MRLMAVEERDAKSMLMRLEDEYRKASISEKKYAELKKKYSEMLEMSEKMISEEDINKKR